MWPWFVLALFVAIAIVATVLVAVNGESVLDEIPFIVAFAMFGVVGALILSRASGNRIGAILLWASTTTAIAFLCGEILTRLVLDGTTHGLAVVVVAIVSNVGWVVGIVPVLIFVPFLFPDGHLPSRRWLPVAALCALTLAVFGLGIVIGEPRLTGNTESIAVDNPLFVEALADVQVPDLVISLLLIGCLVASIASLVVRFRRTRGVERQQIKWVVASVVLLLASFVVSSLVSGITGEDSYLVDVLLSGVAFLSLPVAIGIAILQYRLFELDVVVKKTVVAGTVALFVIAAYAAVVGFFGVVTSGRESSATVFVAALLLGIAFRPVTRLARRMADRLVYGRRATPYEVLTEFSERVGDAYATEDVLSRMARILGEGVGAQSARVWLRVGGELRPASSWPSDVTARQPVRVIGEGMPTIEEETAVEVRDKGELLGALSVATAPNDPMTVAKERLVRDLASQAGLVLRNVRLVEELRAAQRRIVAAQDAERRRLERNIHDGAQQQLVALSVKLRLAESFVAKDPAKAEAMLEDVRNETQVALEDLRDLARGIYPPLLADKGLAAALESQARKSAMPVEVSPDGVRRYSQEVEAAVYFCVLEALQNAAKYASASRTSVELGERDGWLTFKVVDDGAGFDPASVARGSGLQGIADRLSALDGKVEVRSAMGEGTTIVGRIPVAAVAERD